MRTPAWLPVIGLAVVAAHGMGTEAVAETRLELRLPLGRVAYQTNERIDVSVGRSAPGALPAADLSEVALPPTGVVSLAATQDAVIVGTEADGAVRALTAVVGKAEEQLLWEHKAPRRLTKQVAAREGMTAVAYWGGTLHLLDGDGALVDVEAFPQDIVDLAWQGDLLLVALADGRLIRLETR